MISEHISENIPRQMKNLNFVTPILMQFLQVGLKFERCKPQKAAGHPAICYLINDVRIFPTVYHRIYCRKFLLLSNQTRRYKIN